MADLARKNEPKFPVNESVAAQPDSKIEVTAQLLSLEPGLFTIWLAPAKVIQTEGGMVLPCARFDPLPAIGQGRAFLSSLTESPLLTPGAPPAFLRIVESRTSVLLTTYKLSGGMIPPEIHLSVVEPPSRRQIENPVPEREGLPSLPLEVMVHLENHGDMKFDGGVWAKAPEADAAIEGFSITPGPGIPSGILEYNAVLGQDWVSPSMPSGEYCGSRQMSLALLGVRISLIGEVSGRYRVQFWGRFGSDEHGPFESGETCEASGSPLTGLRVVLSAHDSARDRRDH